MKTQQQKTRYIPSGYTQYTPEIGDYPKDLFACYVQMSDGKYFAVFYKGKDNTPVFHYRFRNEEAMKEKINGAISNLMAWEDKKLERKQARKQPHTLRAGDIVYSSWGYDQTNVNFYQITKVIGANTVEVCAIASEVVSNDGGPTTHVTAIKDRFLTGYGQWDNTGKKMTRRVSSGNGIKISESQTAFVWDGKPKYETASGWGH